MTTSSVPGRILIVEDERIIAEELSQRLLDAGFEVVGIQRSGEAAVEAVRDRTPDLVLMDIRLDGAMSGIDAATEISGRLEVPVIFLTAHSDRGTILQARDSNPYGYLTKPVDGRALEAAITIALHRSRLERRARESEQRFRSLANSAPIGIFLTDADGSCTYTNPCWRRITGLPEDAALGSGWASAIHPEDRDSVLEWWLRVTADPATPAELEFRFLRPDGSARWVRAIGTALRDPTGRTYGYVGTDEDVTEHRDARALVDQFHARVRQLAQRLENAREDERRAVAQLLHETLAQDLVALQLGLATLRREVGESALGTALVEDLSRVTGASIVTLRKFSAELYPLSVMQLGVAAALRNHVDFFQRRSEARIALDVDPDLPALDKDRALILFRAAQEALTNAAKHSGAQNIVVRLSHLDGYVLVTVEDDGVGIGEIDRSKPESLGLLGMEERLSSVGGHLQVMRVAAGGTALRAAVPAV